MADDKKHKAAIRKELARISKAHGGVLYADDVVVFAENPKTALHSEFTWDDTEAARQFRLDQARRVIRVTVELLADTDTEVQVYVSLNDDRAAPRGGYRRTLDVMADDELREQLLRQARADMKAFGLKYKGLVALAGVIDAMQKVA